MTDDELTTLKAQIDSLSRDRLLDLELNPEQVEGEHNSEYLKSIHAFIFQDSTEYINAGQFREPVEPGWYHTKQRDMYPKGLEVFYSNNPDEHTIDQILSDATIKLQNCANDYEFAQAMSELYSKLDYQHPFIEGNSRTLRYFTSVIAHDYGYNLDWSKTGDSKLSRVELYVARDTNMIDVNFDFSEEHLQFLKHHNNTEYGKHQEYIDNDMIGFLTSAKSDFKLRSLTDIIHDNLSKQLNVNVVIETYRALIQERFKNDPIKLAEKINEFEQKIPELSNNLEPSFNKEPTKHQVQEIKISSNNIDKDKGR